MRRGARSSWPRCPAPSRAAQRSDPGGLPGASAPDKARGRSGVEEQPGVLDVDVGGRLGLELARSAPARDSCIRRREQCRRWPRRGWPRSARTRCPHRAACAPAPESAQSPERLRVAVGRQQASDQALPGIGAIRMAPQHLAGRWRRPARCCCAADRCPPTAIRARRWAGRRPRSAAWPSVPADPAQPQTGWPADRSRRASTESRDRPERRLVGGRRHLLHIGDGLRVLAQLVMRADHAHPRGEVAGIVVQNLRIQRRGLVVSAWPPSGCRRTAAWYPS
jgi:hypothetical protein